MPSNSAAPSAVVSSAAVSPAGADVAVEAVEARSSLTSDVVAGPDPATASDRSASLSASGASLSTLAYRKIAPKNSATSTGIAISARFSHRFMRQL